MNITNTLISALGLGAQAGQYKGHTVVHHSGDDIAIETDAATEREAKGLLLAFLVDALGLPFGAFEDRISVTPPSPADPAVDAMFAESATPKYRAQLIVSLAELANH